MRGFHRNFKIALVTFCVTGITIWGCAASNRYKAPNPIPSDTHDIPKPDYQKINYLEDGFNKIVTLQVEQSFDIARQLRHIFDMPKQAFNVNAFDNVPNSSWFTNRNAYKKMSIQDIETGPDTGTGPDTSHSWIITRAKVEGITPGFHIKDNRGDRYLIKFDPVGYSEMATGAEVITTKLFYAAGYNVPENYITYFDPKILKAGKEVTFTDENGDDRPMTDRDIQAILNKVEHLPNGMIRALASKYIKGEIIGGFKYEGTRQDDPNDFIPHQHRRELRGLYVMCAWLKHFDTKAGNNLDTYVNENGKQYVKHYLIDFGSTLGSAAHSPQPPYKGHENDLDGHAILENIATAGLYVRPWEKLGPIQYPSIGRFGHELFQPGDTKPNYPNPAFENCTHRDGYWGAKLVMSFTDEQLAAIVKQGQYSNPDAEAYLLQILKKRRDKTGRYWFTRINPLDHFKIVENKLCFQDLGVKGNLWKKEKSKYVYTVRLNGTKPLFSKISQISHIHLNDLQNSPHSISKDDQIEIEIRVKRLMENKLSKWVRIYLKQSPSGDWECLGIRREE